MYKVNQFSVVVFQFLPPLKRGRFHDHSFSVLQISRHRKVTSCSISFTRDPDLTAIQPTEPASSRILWKNFFLKELPPGVPPHETIKSLLGLFVRCPKYFRE